MRTVIISAVWFAVAAVPGMAQPQQHGDAQSPPASVYAGQEKRDVKALSEQEQHAWLEGQGMGLARAAELNGYPGPMHVLELADPLRLTPAQTVTTRELMNRHKVEVRKLGAQLVETERHLDGAFRERRVSDAGIEHMTGEIGELQARIRASHLQTHLAQTALLTPEQVAEYSRLRGYGR